MVMVLPYRLDGHFTRNLVLAGLTFTTTFAVLACLFEHFLDIPRYII